MTLDLSIGRGDNAPSPMWTLPFDPTGSDIVVVITMPGGSLLTLTSDGGDLVLDAAARSVTWLVTTAQSALLPPTSFYTLRRVVPGGEVRYYAQGRIFGVDGPVGPASVVVTGAGPQGVPGSAGTSGPAGASAYDLAGGDAVWGSLPAWLASLASGGAERSYALAIAAHGQTVLPISPPPALLSTLCLTVNGIDYRAPLALSATELAVTWSGGFALDPSDDVHVSYF